MSEANKAIVCRFLDAVWNKHNLAIFDELTLYPLLLAARPFLAAFPDVRATIDEQIAAGDKTRTLHGNFYSPSGRGENRRTLERL